MLNFNRKFFQRKNKSEPSKDLMTEFLSFFPTLLLAFDPQYKAQSWCISEKHQISFFSLSFINFRHIKGIQAIHRIQAFKWKHTKANSMSLAGATEQNSGLSVIPISVSHICYWLCDLWSIYKMKIIILAFSGGLKLINYSFKMLAQLCMRSSSDIWTHSTAVSSLFCQQVSQDSSGPYLELEVV